MDYFDNLTLFDYPQKQSKTTKKEDLRSVDLEKEPSSIVVENDINGGGVMIFSYDLYSNVPQNEIDNIKTYREIALSSDVDLILNEIRNEVFIFDVPDKKAIELNFNSKCKLSESIKKKIHEEFDNIYSIMQFDKKGIDYFNSFYVDGRLYLHKVVDFNDIKSGIKKIVKIDPLKIKKVKEVPKRDRNTGTYNLSEIKEYYVYFDTLDTLYGNNSGYANYNSQIITFGKNTAFKLNKETIAYCDSGIYANNMVLGFLHKAIVPFNNLKMMEEALLIYRVSRAPERRVIYVDVGNLPKNKAEQYMREMMNRFKNKLVYDSKTGTIMDKRNVVSMMEDYWLPRREGGRGTEITTLQGGENLGVIEDVDYFKNKLLSSLNVPMSRFADNSPSFVFGKGIEIQRDEYRFKKFIDRLRQLFVAIFEDLLKTQLLLKNIITEDDWNEIKNYIMWNYAEDNAFVEFKESEILNNRIATLSQIDNFTEKYFSRKWIMRNVLKFNDEEYEKMMEEIKNEKDLLPKNEPDYMNDLPQ